MINFSKITGSVAKRMGHSDRMLEDVFETVGHSTKRIKIEKFQNILDDHLPFPTKVFPLDDPKVAGYMRPINHDGRFLGAGLALPYDEFLGLLKLDGENLDTVFHELSHATHCKVDGRISANEEALKKLILKKFETAPDVDYSGINNKINDLYQKSFYEWGSFTEQGGNFGEKFLSGGEAKAGAIKDRLQNIAEETEKIANEIPDNELKIAFLKRMRNGLRSENYAWGQGAKFKAQAELNKTVQTLIEKDGRVDELLELETKDKSSYLKKINEYFEKADFCKKQGELTSKIEWNNDIAYMFGEKINYLNDKIATLIRTERRNMVFNKALVKSSTENLALPNPVVTKCKFIDLAA